MRKAQKQEVLECIDSLQQAHEEIRSACAQGDPAILQNMLSECQEFAVSLGEMIERLEGQGHVTVSFIERYCEILFHVYEMTDQGQADPGKISKILKKHLLKVENSARHDIRVKREVVFFPYKAAMWDSLESVYLAAREDPDCDAYCVPIPYYDLNPDKSFGQMHYEGDAYPANIRVTDWRTYSFEERRPDIIYIHNAYDNWNLVTSIHPRFYAENLKKYTDSLIYIPYFVLNDIDPDAKEVVDKIKHFCFAPGIIYADKVFVQSEKMRQIYISEYLRAAKDIGLTGKHLDKMHLEQKFLGLGSPKYDKVHTTKKEELEIPQGWERIIKKPDGSWKKIILYNTGVSALLANGQKWIEKIEDVLKIFEKDKDEVVLMWRPHPLIESTLQSMRPAVLAQYQMLKERYLAGGWGIFDETADVDRAIVLSDAYYGDNSSLVQLYQQTGKPVMIQNMEIKSQDLG